MNVTDSNKSWFDKTTSAERFVNPTEFRVWFSIDLFVLVTGFCLSPLFITALLSHHDNRTGGGLLFLHSVIIDAQVGTVYHVGFLVMTFGSQNGFRVPPRFCHHFHYAYMVTLMAGQWNMCFLAVNRAIAIVWPHSYSQWSRKRIIFSQIFGSWVIGCSSILCFYLNIENGFVSVGPYGLCTYGSQGLDFQLANLFDTYLPLGLTEAVYILLFLKLHNCRCRPISSQTVSRSGKHQLLLANLLFASSIVHCLCLFLPLVLIAVAPTTYFGYSTSRLWTQTVFFGGFLFTPVSLTQFSSAATH